MPELDDNTGEINFDNLTLADILNQETGEPTQEKKETKPELTNVPDSNAILINRIASLEQNNRTMQGLMMQLVNVLSQKEEPTQEEPEIDVGNEFSEPDKVKSLVSTITDAVTSQVISQIEKKFGPSMSAIENVQKTQQLEANLNTEYQQFKLNNPDVDNYALGMRYLNAQGAASNFQTLYNLAKQFGLTNEKFTPKPKQEPKENTNVRNFPPRIESSSVDTTTKKKITSLREAIASAFEESA